MLIFREQPSISLQVHITSIAIRTVMCLQGGTTAIHRIRKQNIEHF